MKKIKILLPAMMIMTIMILTVGCDVNTGKGGQTVSDNMSPVIGDWAYNHDTATSILSLNGNMTAVYNGIEYTYSMDETFIYFMSSEEEFRLRYEYDENHDTMDLYEIEKYTYRGEGTPDSLVGYWSDDAGNWWYEFTDNGTFSEGGVFNGNYADNKEEGFFKMMYTDPIEDTIVYYSIDGNEITFEYPWTMVRTTNQ